MEFFVYNLKRIWNFSVCRIEHWWYSFPALSTKEISLRKQTFKHNINLIILDSWEKSVRRIFWPGRSYTHARVPRCWRWSHQISRFEIWCQRYTHTQTSGLWWKKAHLSGCVSFVRGDQREKYFEQSASLVSRLNYLRPSSWSSCQKSGMLVHRVVVIFVHPKTQQLNRLTVIEYLESRTSSIK